MNTGELCAAIDVGTNTALLLVGRFASDGTLDVVFDTSVTARLGEGLARTGAMQPEAMDRTLAILADFQSRLARLEVPSGRVRCAGTAVFRRASNGAMFAERCTRELGLELDIVSEQDEARLGFAAVASLAPPGAPAPAVVDVGGGSSEVVRAAGTERHSLPIGAVVLTERFLAEDEGSEPRGPRAVFEEVARQCTALPNARDPETVLLIGGTAVNLACLELGLAAFDPTRVEGECVNVLSARRQSERLFDLSIEERMALPIEADRAAILPAGLACIAGVLDRMEPAEVRVSTRGLRFGLLRDAFGPSPT